jgi:hypothetical protein
MYPLIYFQVALFTVLSGLLVVAQDGGITGPTSSSEAAGYSCDPDQCKLPNCNCASTSPPGGLQPVGAPVFAKMSTGYMR